MCRAIAMSGVDKIVKIPESRRAVFELLDNVAVD
jgi:hypothetical protein